MLKIFQALIQIIVLRVRPEKILAKNHYCRNVSSLILICFYFVIKAMINSVFCTTSSELSKVASAAEIIQILRGSDNSERILANQSESIKEHQWKG